MEIQTIARCRNAERDPVLLLVFWREDAERAHAPGNPAHGHSPYSVHSVRQRSLNPAIGRIRLHRATSTTTARDKSVDAGNTVVRLLF